MWGTQFSGDGLGRPLQQEEVWLKSMGHKIWSTMEWALDQHNPSQEATVLLSPNLDCTITLLKATATLVSSYRRCVTLCGFIKISSVQGSEEPFKS